MFESLSLQDLKLSESLLLSEPKPCCDNPNKYSDLRRHVDEDGSTGLIVQLGCSNCGRIFGWMHPYAWLDVYEGKELTDVCGILKRGSE